MEILLAYHNDPAIKAKYIARVRAHRAADELIQGTPWEDGKGCAIGCTLNAYKHDRYPIELGIPIRLAYLEDRLFELQTKDGSMAWPERFLAAIQPGADLSRVWPQWAVWMLVDPDHGVIRHANGRKDVESAIRRVAELWERGGTPEEFWRARDDAAAAAAAAYAAAAAAAAAAYAAYATAAYAAYAAYATAAYAAYATYAAAAYAAYATYAAAAAAAGLKAKAEWVVAACDKLIALLESAPCL